MEKKRPFSRSTTLIKATAATGQVMGALTSFPLPQHWAGGLGLAAGLIHPRLLELEAVVLTLVNRAQRGMVHLPAAGVAQIAILWHGLSRLDVAGAVVHLGLGADADGGREAEGPVHHSAGPCVDAESPLVAVVAQSHVGELDGVGPPIVRWVVWGAEASVRDVAQLEDVGGGHDHLRRGDVHPGHPHHLRRVQPPQREALGEHDLQLVELAARDHEIEHERGVVVVAREVAGDHRDVDGADEAFAHQRIVRGVGPQGGPLAHGQLVVPQIRAVVVRQSEALQEKAVVARLQGRAGERLRPGDFIVRVAVPIHKVVVVQRRLRDNGGGADWLPIPQPVHVREGPQGDVGLRGEVELQGPRAQPHVLHVEQHFRLHKLCARDVWAVDDLEVRDLGALCEAGLVGRRRHQPPDSDVDVPGAGGVARGGHLHVRDGELCAAVERDHATRRELLGEEVGADLGVADLRDPAAAHDT
mmetsp:Transcript_88058/g.146452  ORF Transcript_88058/g.146452 Transcript_88058/m.146452 type:complete len:472 (-) Transcript_88058:1207-2622(-)